MGKILTFIFLIIHVSFSQTVNSTNLDDKYYLSVLESMGNKRLALTNIDSLQIIDAYKHLILLDTEEAVDAILKSVNYLICEEGSKEKDRVAYFIERALDDVPQMTQNLYQYIFKRVEIDKKFPDSFPWVILGRIDKNRCFYDLLKIQSDNLKTFKLWKLGSLKNKEIINYLNSFKPGNIYEDIYLATSYCLVNYNYDQNFNYLLNLVRQAREYESATIIDKDLFTLDVVLISLDDIGDPSALDVLYGIRYKGVLSDYFIEDSDLIIDRLEKSKEYLHYSHISSSVSSTLIDKRLDQNYYDVWNLFDSDENTAWVEGIAGNGIGEWVQFDFDSINVINGIELINGYAKNRYSYDYNNRVKSLNIEFSDGTFELIKINDQINEQKITFPNHQTSSVRFIITDIYKGSKYSDTCISEIKILKVE